MGIINVEALCKTYRRLENDGKWRLLNRRYSYFQAVDNISFSIDEGEIVGYLGPNGAGKSTTIKMLAGILKPTSGNISVCGIDPMQNRKDNATNISVTFGQRSQLNWDLPVRDSLLLAKYMYGLSHQTFQDNLSLLDRYLEIKDIIDVPVRQLSLGQRMRADFAFSMIHMPKVLFLDEPTIGLDVLVKEQLCSCIKEINKECGVTVLITTHDVQDIEQLCKNVIIIDKGKVRFHDSLTKLRSIYGTSKIIIKFDNVENKGKICELLKEENIFFENYSDEYTIAINQLLNNEELERVLHGVLAKTPSIDSIQFRDNELSTVLKKIYVEMKGK